MNEKDLGDKKQYIIHKLCSPLAYINFTLKSILFFFINKGNIQSIHKFFVQQVGSLSRK